MPWPLVVSRWPFSRAVVRGISVWLLSLLLLGRWVAVSAAPQVTDLSSEAGPPPATAPVQALLTECRRRLDSGMTAEALQSGEEAVAAARAAHDMAGEGRACGLRGIVLLRQNNPEPAITSFRESAGAWHKLGFSPGEVDALCNIALASPPKSAEAASALRDAKEVIATEKARPLTTIDATMKASVRFMPGRPTEIEAMMEAALALCQRVAPESDLTAGVLSFLSQALAAAQQYEAAEENVRHAIKIIARIDPNSLHEAMLLHNLGVTLTLQLRPAEVVPVCERSLTLYQKLDPSTEALVGSWGLLEQALEGLGQIDRAEQVTRTTLDGIERYQPDNHYRVDLLEKLAELSEKLGKYAAGSRYYVAASERRKSAGDAMRAVGDLLTAAELAQDDGKVEGADRLVADASAVCDAAGGNRLLQARVRTTRGFIVSKRGQHQQALALHREALAMRTEAAPNSGLVADSRWRIAGEARDLGDFATNWQELTLALEILEKTSPSSTQTAQVTDELARAAIDRGDYLVAHRLLIRALEISEVRGDDDRLTANILIDRGNLALHENDLTEALAQYQKAKGVLERSAPGSGLLAMTMSNIAGVYMHRKQPSNAAGILDKAIALFEKVEPECPQLATAMNNRAGCLDDLGKREDADRLRRRALDLWKRTDPNSPIRAHVLLEHAARERDRGHAAEALAAAEEAWGLMRSLAQDVDEDEARQDVTARDQGPAANMLAKILLDSGHTDRALQVLEQSRSQALWRSLIAGRARPSRVSDRDWADYSTARSAREDANARLARAWDTRGKAVGAAATAHKNGADAGVLKRLDQEAEEAQHSVDWYTSALQDARIREVREWAKLRGRSGSVSGEIDTAADRRKLAPKIASGTLFLYYTVGDSATRLFVLGSGGTPTALKTFRLPLTSEQLTQKVRAVIRALREDRADAASQSLALCRTILPEPALSAVLKAKRLVIVPDGVLWEMPFAALAVPPAAPTSLRPGAKAKGAATAVGAGPRYLGLLKPLCSVSSLALFVRGDQPGPKPPLPVRDHLLAVGDPAFSGMALRAANARLPELRGVDPVLPVPTPLPGTREDAEGVARLYGGVAVLGEAATEREVRKRLSDADIVHLATHGWAHPYWSGGSRVFLAASATGDTDPSDDGMLEAWEIATQLQIHADLVVLAACETDLGPVAPWEGVNGLTRALLRAGARSVVASHWEVRDDSTRALMLAFHRGIHAGKAKDEALRAAMAEVAERPQWRHPYFWAAFALTGDRENRLFPPALKQ